MSKLSELKITEQYFVDNLDRAIREEWIKAYHQPLIRAASGHVSDEEAFARWEDPEYGVFTPADFLPVLEREKLTYKLDLYMAERVLKKMKDQGEHGLFIVPESINLASTDFESCDMVEEIVKRVDASGLSRDKLSVELSERTISKDISYMKTVVERFRAAGIKVWMDDYGSGYSSLLILLKIKFDLLKIDQTFVELIGKQEDAQIIITELIKTALSLGMDTVAEGVETREQVDFLTEIGCTKLQGYYYIHPISLAQIISRNQMGTQIGFENPAEAEYYDKLGKVNLYDLSISRSDESNADLQDYFDTLPMAIFSMGSESAAIIRSNKSFKEFVSNNFPVFFNSPDFKYSDMAPGVGYYTFKSILQCAQDGKRAIIDDRLSDGRSIQLFLRKIAENPVKKTSAVAVAVLSVTDKPSEESLTYNYIARALSSDYINLYYVNMDTEEFTEFVSDGESRDISFSKHGDHFFDLTRKEFDLEMTEEDKAALIREFTKENFQKGLDKNGSFSVVTRIFLNGVSTYVTMKAVKVRGEGNNIIVGLVNVDDQIKNRELANLAREEKLVYSRIGALSGEYIFLYTIDPVTGHYTKYNPSGKISGIGIANEGDNFFEKIRKEAQVGVHPDDLDEFLSVFTTDNIMKQIATRGIFENSHRLMIAGSHIHVIMRGAMVNEDGQEKLILGIIDVDDRVKKEQEYQEHIFAVENKAALDELTGVKNKHAYSENEELLNVLIDKKKAPPFAIAVFDLNGLKQINDTYGHQAGDEFIKNGCSIICNFFKHSPVFRVGGDEFAVIVQGNDYNNIDSIMKRFEANNLKNKERGTVVIAAGVSRFNADTDVSEVFSRADIEMYENKRKLKGA